MYTPEKLYGSDRNASKKQFRYKIRVWDSAKEYTTPDKPSVSTNTEGNSTDIYYLASDLYDKVLSKHKIQTVYAILNGTYGSASDKERSAADLEAEKQTVKTHENTIKTLNDNITELQTTLDETKNQKDSMNIFGALLSKGLYNTIMWGIVLVLAVLLIFYIYKYANGNVVTKKSISDLAELQEEYENYRKAAIEREQKVRRQLQDEINKHR